jgi:hypothetical protein
MNADFSVVAVRELASPDSPTVELDGIVPLSYRLRDVPPGSGYFMFRGSPRRLLEVGVSYTDQAVTSLTIVAYEASGAWPDLSIDGRQQGVPVLATRFSDYEIVDVELTFGVAVDGRRVVAYWGALGRCAAIEMGRSAFLVRDSTLVGFLVSDLTVEEVEAFHHSASP